MKKLSLILLVIVSTLSGCMVYDYPNRHGGDYRNDRGSDHRDGRSGDHHDGHDGDRDDDRGRSHDRRDHD